MTIYLAISIGGVLGVIFGTLVNIAIDRAHNKLRVRRLRNRLSKILKQEKEERNVRISR
jgi:hypothetical protein